MLAHLTLGFSLLAGSGGPPPADETIPWFGETFCEKPILMQMTPDTPEMRLFLYGLGEDVCFSHKWGTLPNYLRPKSESERPKARGSSVLEPDPPPKRPSKRRVPRRERRRSSRQFINEMIIRQHCSWNGPLCVQT